MQWPCPAEEHRADPVLLGLRRVRIGQFLGVPLGGSGGRLAEQARAQNVLDHASAMRPSIDHDVDRCPRIQPFDQADGCGEPVGCDQIGLGDVDPVGELHLVDKQISHGAFVVHGVDRREVGEELSGDDGLQGDTTCPEIHGATANRTDTVFSADTPGHVVSHDGNLVLFGDGDGTMQRFSTDDLLALSGDDPAPEATVDETEPHHGVAVELSDGTFVHTEGTEEYRDTVTAVDADGEEIASSSDCPGVHGEAAAADDVLAFGCEDGILIFDDGEFTKVDAPDSYGRIGNQAGSEVSPVVLGDYKVEEDLDDDEIERPERVSLTNTATGELQLVDLDASYSFRSLGRGPDGEALVLGTDGKLHVIDPESGDVTDSWEVIDPWEEPVEWQEPSPTLFVQSDRAYVTEPETNEIHAVDLSTGGVVGSVELDDAPNELTGVTG